MGPTEPIEPMESIDSVEPTVLSGLADSFYVRFLNRLIKRRRILDSLPFGRTFVDSDSSFGNDKNRIFVFDAKGVV